MCCVSSRRGRSLLDGKALISAFGIRHSHHRPIVEILAERGVAVRSFQHLRTETRLIGWDIGWTLGGQGTSKTRVSLSL